jgi:hypothetical protein
MYTCVWGQESTCICTMASQHWKLECFLVHVEKRDDNIKRARLHNMYSESHLVRLKIPFATPNGILGQSRF